MKRKTKILWQWYLRLIEDLIEDDMEAERLFREEVRKFIDDKIEEQVVERALQLRFNSTSIRSYMSKFEDNGGYYIDGVPIYGL